jgi:hypothetical protein
VTLARNLAFSPKRRNSYGALLLFGGAFDQPRHGYSNDAGNVKKIVSL